MRYLLMICALGLVSGCATKPTPAPVLISDYCDKDAPLYFKAATEDYLFNNDPVFYRDVVTHNETHDRLCPKVD